MSRSRNVTFVSILSLLLLAGISILLNGLISEVLHHTLKTNLLIFQSQEPCLNIGLRLLILIIIIGDMKKRKNTKLTKIQVISIPKVLTSQRKVPVTQWSSILLLSLLPQTPTLNPKLLVLMNHPENRARVGLAIKRLKLIAQSLALLGHGINSSAPMVN